MIKKDDHPFNEKFVLGVVGDFCQVRLLKVG